MAVIGAGFLGARIITELLLLGNDVVALSVVYRVEWELKRFGEDLTKPQKSNPPGKHSQKGWDLGSMFVASESFLGEKNMGCFG